MSEIRTDYNRQSQLFDPALSHKQIVVVGAGGIGSFLVFNLAKCGFQKITVFDGDSVENHNTPNQMYGLRHVGQKKVNALASIVKALTEVDIDARGEFVESIEQLPTGPEVIYVFALDSLEVRQKLYEQLKGTPNFLVDGRMGGEGYSISIISLDGDTKKYEEQLYVTGSEDPCGQRAIIYTLTSLAAEMTNQIKRLDAGQKHTASATRHMSKLFFLGG